MSKDNWNRRSNKSSGSSHSSRYSRDEKNRSQPRGSTAAGTEPKLCLKEEQVGITEYVTSGKGFTGVVKARFSDFHVNEIDENGKILQLNDLFIPQPKEDDMEPDVLEKLKCEMSEIITPILWGRIDALSHYSNIPNPPERSIALDVTTLNKDQRTKIHQMIKKLYERTLLSTTTDSLKKGEEDKRFIMLYPRKGREDRHRWNYPHEYVHFLVHKENMETGEVAAIIAGRLGLRPSQVNYCGTKDKRAKTTQKFCIKRRSPTVIANCVKNMSTLHVGNFEFNEEVLKLGQLKGNRFRIALRHVRGEDADIEATLKQIKEHGFINYYGLQRFGNCASVPTYEVGIALLKCDYKLACELIMKPRDNDAPFMREIRKEWWTNRNSAVAGAMLYGDKFIEKKLLTGLVEFGEKNYAAALRKIPRNMLLLYPHSFQSLVFNRIVTRRIKEFGLKLIPGDLVFQNKDEQDTDFTIETEEYIAPLEVTPSTSDASKTKMERGKEEKEPEIEDKQLMYKRNVKVLTVEDVSSGEWTLFDVVLPLPGFDVTLPENEVGKWYDEILGEYGLSIAKLKHNIKIYAMTGAYRKMIIKPEKMEWEFKSYNQPESTLIASDWEILEKNIDQVLSDCSATGGRFKAVLINIDLPTAAYATMFLREVLKTDTSAATQSQLEQAELRKHNESEENRNVVDAKITCEKRKKAEDGAVNGTNGFEAEANDAKKKKDDQANHQ